MKTNVRRRSKLTNIGIEHPTSTLHMHIDSFIGYYNSCPVEDVRIYMRFHLLTAG
jgi:hypothetical protein